MSGPLPIPDPDSEPFWLGCREGVLRAQRCQSCQRFRWPPMEFCPHCHAMGGEWTPLRGRGTVRSFVIVERAFDPAFTDKVPYAIAHICLVGAEDIVMIANLVTAPPHTPAVGLTVELAFEERGDIALPVFRSIGPT